MPEQDALPDLVILGGGTAGWMSAALLSKLFPAMKITLLESEEIGTVGVGEATIPAIRTFNSLIDIAEPEFIRATAGSFKLGIEFKDWLRLGHSYFHPFGKFGQEHNGLPFHQLWLSAASRAETGALDEYCLSAAAARLGRFQPVRSDPRAPFIDLQYAYHFDAGLFAALLRKRAERAGVSRIEGKAIAARRNAGGDIASIELDDGRTVGGDLFIDCSGFRGLLIDRTLDVPYEDWQDWLPCDTAVVVGSEPVGAPPPFTRAAAQPAGWQWRIPLQHRVGNGHIFSSRFMSVDEATDILLRNIEGPALGAPRTLRFTTGRRQRMWDRNVVAIGLSSGFLEPLESTSIHLIQMALAKLVANFPGRRIDPRLRDEFNAVMGEMFEHVRNFLVLHYTATERDDSPFWQRCRQLPLPEALVRKLDAWRAAGQVLRYGHDEVFTEPSWVAVLLGQGISPERPHPAAAALPADFLDGALRHMRTEIATVANAMPPHSEFIVRHCAAAPLA